MNIFLFRLFNDFFLIFSESGAATVVFAPDPNRVLVSSLLDTKTSTFNQQDPPLENATLPKLLIQLGVTLQAYLSFFHDDLRIREI